MTSIVKCPNCKKDVEWSSASIYKPFCSERCKLIDLGAWADGSYSIPTQESPDTDEERPNKDSEED